MEVLPHAHVGLRGGDGTGEGEGADRTYEATAASKNGTKLNSYVSSANSTYLEGVHEC